MSILTIVKTVVFTSIIGNFPYSESLYLQDKSTNKCFGAEGIFLCSDFQFCNDITFCDYKKFPIIVHATCSFF